MFSWFKRKPSESSIILSRLDYLQSEIDRWHRDQTIVINRLNDVKMALDEAARIAISDIQGRYIKALEDKLVRFDDEVKSLKNEREVDRVRMHQHIYRS